MSGQILLSTQQGDQGLFAKAINKIVKQFRNKNRPFITLVVEEDGNCTVLSNMDHSHERIKLLEQTCLGLLNNTHIRSGEKN